MDVCSCRTVSRSSCLKCVALAQATWANQFGEPGLSPATGDNSHTCIMDKACIAHTCMDKAYLYTAGRLSLILYPCFIRALSTGMRNTGMLHACLFTTP